MNGPDYLAAAAALFNTFTFNQLLPGLSLVFLAWLLVRVLGQAQRSGTFNSGDFLRDEGGKPSWRRLVGFLCFMAHTWVLFVRTVTDRVTFEEQALYGGLWSGSAVVLLVAEAWTRVRMGAQQPASPAQAPAPGQQQ